MTKKLQSALCVALAGGFLCLWGVSHKNDIAVMTSGGNVSQPIQRQVVVLDAGHGGIDGGCVAIDGTAEKDINLPITQTERDLLTVLGFDVKCTRESDVSIYDEGTQGLSAQKKSDMKNRLELFSKYTDGISLSIHQNQFTDSKYSGAQMFYRESSSESGRLAQVMQQQFVALIQPENKRETKPVTDELYLLANTECPALMIECGFLSNPEECEKLESEEYQKQVAFTIMTGIFEFVAEKG